MLGGKKYTIHQRGNGDGCRYVYGVKGGIEIVGRSIVGLTATRLAVPAGHADAVAIVGIAEAYVDNRTGADNAKTVCAQRGVFAPSMANAKAADISKPVYAVSPEEVTATAGGGKLQAGVLDGIDGDGAWVRF